MDEPDISAVVVHGQFTVAEYGEVVALLRAIDGRHTDPERHFEIVAVDAGKGPIETGVELLREVLPPKPGRQTRLIQITSRTDGQGEQREFQSAIGAAIASLAETFVFSGLAAPTGLEVRPGQIDALVAMIREFDPILAMDLRQNSRLWGLRVVERDS